MAEVGKDNVRQQIGKARDAINRTTEGQYDTNWNPRERLTEARDEVDKAIRDWDDFRMGRDKPKPQAPARWW